MAKNIYRILISIITIILISFLFTIVEDVLIIGSKLNNYVHPYVGYLFYLITILTFIMFVVIPIIKIMMIPKLPVLDIKKDTSYNEIKRLAHKLLKNCGYISNKSDREIHYEKFKQKILSSNNVSDLTSVVKKEVEHRFDHARKEIIKSAALSFTSTSVSQNSTIDALSVLFINCKLIYRVIASTGFRPSLKQLIRIYVNVIFSVFFAHLSQSGIEKGASLLLDKFIDGVRNTPIAKVFIGSVVDGTMNAIITLRIGFLTISYLKMGAQGKISEEDKKNAVKNAIAAIPKALESKTVKVIVDFASKFTKENCCEVEYNTEIDDLDNQKKEPLFNKILSYKIKEQ